MSDLASEYRMIHAAQPSYGSADRKMMRYINPLIESLNCARVIDYGCGKGALGKFIQASTGIETQFYDPYVPEFSTRPDGRFDLLVNTDVLEHIPENSLLSVLDDMKSFSDHCFFVISTRYAEQLLSDGQNAHCTVQPEAWWENILRQCFPYIQRIEIDIADTCAFVTWPLEGSTIRRITSANNRWRIKRKIKRRICELTAWLKIKTNWFSNEADIFNELEGKSVSVVGNARSLSRYSYGDDIDRHDIVIRFNQAPIASLKRHGRRLDWIATGMALDAGFPKRRGVKRVLWLSPKRKLLTMSMLRDQHMFVLPLKRS